MGANFFIPIKNHKNNNYIEYKINKIKGNRSKYQEKTHPNLGSLFATKDIYSDLKFVCFKFFYFFIYLKILTMLINNKITIIWKYEFVSTYPCCLSSFVFLPFVISPKVIQL